MGLPSPLLTSGSPALDRAEAEAPSSAPAFASAPADASGGLLGALVAPALGRVPVTGESTA
jgi:hypothetical protein